MATERNSYGNRKHSHRTSYGNRKHSHRTIAESTAEDPAESTVAEPVIATEEPVMATEEPVMATESTVAEPTESPAEEPVMATESTAEDPAESTVEEPDVTTAQDPPGDPLGQATRTTTKEPQNRAGVAGNADIAQGEETPPEDARRSRGQAPPEDEVRGQRNDEREIVKALPTKRVPPPKPPRLDPKLLRTQKEGAKKGDDQRENTEGLKEEEEEWERVEGRAEKNVEKERKERNKGRDGDREENVGKNEEETKEKQQVKTREEIKEPERGDTEEETEEADRMEGIEDSEGEEDSPRGRAGLETSADVGAVPPKRPSPSRYFLSPLARLPRRRVQKRKKGLVLPFVSARDRAPEDYWVAHEEEASTLSQPPPFTCLRRG
ncbi:hypothetical protein C7M84_008256 [Penaeus vannamei]|uniref:Uncharacterized protein n=1 Tax=Penaeus vannamei TaxID=6689 RepID=A0A3R7PPT7_PENVA|nr:hypothetical protein C7M84_008256 [Penaeus vannamei]